MTDDERQHLQQLLDTYRRRQRVLEQQIATFGPRTAPEVRIELDDVTAAVAGLQAELRADLVRQPWFQQLWYTALAACYAQQWAEAEGLLARVHALAPEHEDVQTRLDAVREQRKVWEFYAYLGQLQQQDEWRAVLNAMDELAQRYPGFADPQGLRQWAERRRRREQATKLCPACGAINPAHLALCLHCGARIVSEQQM